MIISPPATSSFSSGVDVPMPTLPEDIVVPVPSTFVPKIRFPIDNLFEPLSTGISISVPIIILLFPAVDASAARLPKKILLEPASSKKPACVPMTVLALPEV